ncbi:MAG: anthranilate synthase component I [Rickettsiales bacterium]
MTKAEEQKLYPDEQEFCNIYNQGKSQLVWTSLPADLDTPVAAMLRLMKDDEPSFLLESVEKGKIRGRYSIIGLMPDIIWRCTGNQAEISELYDSNSKYSDFSPVGEDSLTSFRNLYEASKIDIPEGLPPMASGLVGTMGYDMVKLMEKLPSTKNDSIKIPDSHFMRPRIMVIFDNITDKMFIIASAFYDLDKNSNSLAYAKEAYKEATALIDKTIKKLNLNIPRSDGESYNSVKISDFVSNTSRDKYDEMLNKAKEYIYDGDIFQVVLSQRFSAQFNLPPFSLYRALRQLNPSPFLFYLNFGNYQLVGSSPEILVRLRDGEVTIRPIAGTRKRGKNKDEDAALAADLLADQKEISEHLMLLDLGRNDVGRVAKTGSVKTTDKMSIENYSHVMHIVSNVIGDINPEYDALSALIAGFPAGTVSGAPKIRAMEIIDELEVESRSFYAGCIGYFSGNGNMDTCITLRTALIKDNIIYIQAGGGIVADSNSDDEYQESLNKARALMKAAQETINFV